jgi:hypothetical protein
MSHATHQWVGRVADSLPPSKRGFGYCVEEVAVVAVRPFWSAATRLVFE